MPEARPGPAPDPMQAAAPVPAAGEPDVVLDVRDLSVSYSGGGRPLPAVQHVDLTLRRGQVLGLAGESGCGKSTLALAIARLLPRGAATAGGRVTFYPPATGPGQAPRPVDVLGLAGEELRAFRWSRMSMVFQGAMNGLNPVLTIGSQIADAVKAHDRRGSRRSRRERAGQLLDMVGVGASLLGSYSHQLSGGMRQRVMLAMALALDPDVVLMDEPTTALDVVVQRELLDQIRALQDRLGFAVLFITHDLSLLLDVADRVSIMYGGRIVEEASAAQLAADPAHPYSAALLHSFPLIHDSRRSLAGIPGAPPALDSMPAGCPFHPRCPQAGGQCRAQVPALAPYRAGDGARRAVACWHPADSRRPAAGHPEVTR